MDSPRPKVLLLGPVEVRSGTRHLITAPGQKALLAVLALNVNRALSLQQLTDALWLEAAQPDSAFKTLQVLIARTRKAFADDGVVDAIETMAGSHRLNGPSVDIDAERFGQLALQAKGVANAEPKKALQLLDEALALWRGHALLDLRDRPFATYEGDRLDQAQFDAQEQRARLRLQLGEFEEAIPDLRRLVSEQPARERAHEMLMRALYAIGRQTDALSVYHSARRVLEEELGIDPGPELEELQRAILNQDPSLRPAPSSPKLPREAPAQSERQIASERPGRARRYRRSRTAPIRTSRAEHAGLPVSSTPPEARQERKLVTVLFCDLIDFTAASDDADPEDVQARLRPYHASVRHEIERFGGTVEKFIGDAVVGVFGAPVVHEDDPERAVLSGLAILETLQKLNVSQPGLNLRVRVGVNSGPALVSVGAAVERGEGMVTGDVVNTAARIQAIAPENEVVVGERTRTASARHIDYESLGSVLVKGKAAPVQIFRARSAHRPAPSAGASSPAMIGRVAELAIARAAFDRAERDRTVQLVTIVGEPGIGKSTLVRELARQLEQRTDVLVWRQGRCLPYGEGIALWALGEMVKAQTGILETDTADIAADKLETSLPADLPEHAWLVGHLRPLVGLEAGAPIDRDEAFAAWRHYLEWIATSGPAVFVFDDLHWADDALLSFLEYLTDWSESVPMLVIGTARPELHHRRSGWAGGTKNALTIELTPLAVDDVAQLVRGLPAAAGLSPADRAVVIERAGGNPLFAEECARLLQERDSGGGAADRPASALPLPDTVGASIAARIDTLPADAKEVLQDAAVVGKVFWAGAVAAIGGRSTSSVVNGLHELSRRAFVRRLPHSSMAGEDEYSFWHELVRDVAYEQIPRVRRIERHRRAAVWIESKTRERTGDVADVVAHHYLTAARLAKAAGRGDDARTLESAALTSLRQAGERALGLDPAEAERRFASALTLTPEGHPGRPAVLAQWAAAARHSRPYSEVAAALDDSIAGLKAQDDIIGAARATSILSSVQFVAGEARGLQTAEEAVRLLEAVPPGPELISAYADMAAARTIAGDHVAADEWADRSLRLAEEIGVDPPPRALGIRGYGRLVRGDAGGIEDLRAGLALALERGRGHDAGVMYNNLASGLVPVAGPAEALAALREGIAFAEGRGLVEDALYMTAGTLDVLIDVGRWDEVLDVASRVSAQFQATGWGLGAAIVRIQRARVMIARGSAADVLTDIEAAVNDSRESGMLEFMVTALATAALANASTGAPARAVEHLKAIAELPNADTATGPYSVMLPAMVRTAAGCGEVGLAERLVRGPTAFRYPRFAVTAAKAAIAEARNQAAQARGLYAAAAEGWREIEVIPELAYALLGQSRASRLVGQAPEAFNVIREARGLFASLGATPATEKLDRLLAAPESPPSHEVPRCPGC